MTIDFQFYMDTYKVSRDEAETRIDELSRQPSAETSDQSESWGDENEEYSKRSQDDDNSEDACVATCNKSSKKAQPTAQAKTGVKPTGATLEVTKERYLHFIRLLHWCCAERSHSQSVEIDDIRSFFEEREKKKPFVHEELDACIDRMAEENKVMRSEDVVYII